MTDQTGMPTGWTRTTIEELFAPLPDGRTLHQGWSPQCDDEPATDSEWGVLRTTAIQPGSFLPEHNKRLPSSLEPRPAIVVESGDILLTCAGPRSRCGVPCLVRSTRPKLMMSGKMYRFRVSSDLLSAAFVEAFLLSSDAQAAIDRMKTGGSDSGLNLTHKRFRQLPILVAPTAEQQRIVEAVDSYLSRLDDAVASLERVQAKLKAYRASVLKAAVEGHLVPTEASIARAEKRDYERAEVLLARILKERRRRWEEAELAKHKAAGKTPKDDKWKAKYDEPVAPDTRTLPELPEGWCWATVDQLSVVVRGASPRPAGDPRYFGGSVPWITVGSLTADEEPYLRHVSESLTEAGRRASRFVEAGTLLLTNSGATLGVPKITLIGGCINDGSVALLHVQDPTKLYLYFFLKTLTQKLRSINQGAAQPNLNTGIVRNISVSVPPVTEQSRIATELERLLSVATAIEADVVAGRKRALRLRQAVLKWAFEGKLVEQDPTDESADKLLASIRAERAAVAPTKKTRGRQTRGAA